MIVYGKNAGYECLKSNQKINKVYLVENFDDKKIMNLIEKRNLNIMTVDKRYLDRKQLDNQGIILDVDDFKYVSLEEIMNSEKEYPLIVMLDHLTDPHNFGAIIRTCEALGVDGIIIPRDRSIEVNSTVIKTSAGAVFNTKICQVSNLTNTIKKMKEANFWFVGSDMDGEVCYNIDYRMRTVLVIGNEGSGMSPIVRDNMDYIVKIPMDGQINSLNASVATGILIYQIREKRR